MKRRLPEPASDAPAAAAAPPTHSATPLLARAPLPAPSARAKWDALLIVAVAWTAHFALFRHFGLYEDDYWIVAEPLTWTWKQAGRHLEYCLFKLPQGRPIGLLLGSIVPFLSFKAFGGAAALPFLYLVASGIVALNALLAYRLLSESYGRTVGLLGALLLTLHAPDTTRPFLVHAFALQPAQTLALLGLLAYARGRRVPAYLLAAASLVTYESGMLAFFAAPLLSKRWDRALVRRWAVHIAITLGIVALVFLLRYAVGEERVARGTEIAGGWSQVPSRILQALVLGPVAAAGAFQGRIDHVLHNLKPLHLVLRFSVALPLLWIVFFRRMAAPDPASRAALLRAIATGLVMFVGGYGLEFSKYHFPPTEIANRLSAVHFGGTVGAALLGAGILSLLWSFARPWPARVVGAGLTAVLVAALWMFGFQVQKGYVASFQHQRGYWTRLVELMPDLSPRSLVILVGAEPFVSEFILSSSWSDCKVLPLLFRGPGKAVPTLVGGYYLFHEGFLEARDGRLWWSKQAPFWLNIDRNAPVQRDDVIVLEHDAAGWKRRVGSISFHGVEIALPAPPQGAKPALDKGPLHALLLGT